MREISLSEGERVQGLFLAAGQISDQDERDGFLRAQCGSDSQLLKEVQSLLAADSAGHSFLDRPAFAAFLPAPGANRESPPPEAFSLDKPNGDGAEQALRSQRAKHPLPHIPGYEFLEVLGRGGMGVVYKARQVRLNRIVALKMIRGDSHIEERDLSRFRKEAEALARPQHSNIVQIFEIGEHDGVPYLALEYVSGGTLAQKIDGTPQRAAWTGELVQTLACAVHAAHEAGIIHRDLKPGNVLLTQEGQAKISDFGLAKKVEEIGHTQSGALMGTPSYMAPEQADGKKDVGPTVDIYALGAILYEMLTGNPPFKGENTILTLDQVRTQEVVRPRSLNPKVPGDLETICLKCLRKEPKRRYQTAQGLAADLGRFRRGEPIKARRARPVERTLRWARRKPAAAAR